MNPRLKAELYALTHRGNPGDTAFYGALAHGAASILELGSGYGRLLPALARPKRRLVGLELDSELLKLAEQSRRRLSPAARGSVQLTSGDMRDFAFARRFQRVFLPYNGLYCLLNKRAAQHCFRAVRAALEPGGLFAFDVWNAEPFHEQSSARSSDEASEAIVELQHRGQTWHVFERSRVSRARQRLDVVYSYVSAKSGVTCEIPIAQRYFRNPEVAALLKSAGFAVQARYGNFERARFTARSPYLIVVACAV